MLALILTLLACRAASATPQDSAGGNPAPKLDISSEIRLAPVVIDGETLFSVRGVTARPADRRAREIAGRIRTVAANSAISPASLAVEEHDWATWILGGGQRLMALFDEDAAIEDTARAPLAEVYRARIGEAVAQWRRSREPGALWLDVLHAIAATIVFVVSGYAGRRASGAGRRLLERRCRERMQRIEDQAFHMLKADQIWRAVIGAFHLVSIAAAAVTIYFYLNYVLALFPWTRGLAKTLTGAAIDPVRTLGLGLIGLLPNFIFLAGVIVVTRYGLNLLRLFFEGVTSGSILLKGFDAEWAWPTFRLLRLLVIALAVVVAYPYIPGSSSEAFKGVSLFIGVIFSLGSSSLIGNVVAGYSMTYRRAFRLGDRVTIGEHTGVVERMRLMVTHLRTPKNEELVVPNSTILTAEVVNYTSLARERGLILHTTVGIGYETPWRQVEAMLLEAAARTPGLLRHPPAYVLQKSLGDYCVTYEINVFCDAPDQLEAFYTGLHRNILDVFNDYGVQIMTPSYEADPAEPKIVPKERWYAAPARASNAGTIVVTSDRRG